MIASSEEEVAYVEIDAHLSGLHHPDQRCLGIEQNLWSVSSFEWKSPLQLVAGQGAEVFVIVTGIRTTHNEFLNNQGATRAKWGAN